MWLKHLLNIRVYISQKKTVPFFLLRTLGLSGFSAIYYHLKSDAGDLVNFEGEKGVRKYNQFGTFAELPSRKLTWLAGKSSFLIGDTHLEMVVVSMVILVFGGVKQLTSTISPNYPPEM